MSCDNEVATTNRAAAAGSQSYFRWTMSCDRKGQDSAEAMVAVSILLSLDNELWSVYVPLDRTMRSWSQSYFRWTMSCDLAVNMVLKSVKGVSILLSLDNELW